MRISQGAAIDVALAYGGPLSVAAQLSYTDVLQRPQLTVWDFVNSGTVSAGTTEEDDWYNDTVGYVQCRRWAGTANPIGGATTGTHKYRMQCIDGAYTLNYVKSVAYNAYIDMSYENVEGIWVPRGYTHRIQYDNGTDGDQTAQRKHFVVGIGNNET